MYAGLEVGLIIPALDEAETVGAVLADVDRSVVDWIVVADNGSRDETGEVAAAAGAEVIREPRRGYGSACLTALRLGRPADVVVFMDADGSDDPRQIGRLLAALVETGSDLVIGSRVQGRSEPGSLTRTQRFGNRLTCGLVRLLWGIRFSDLGPFRAIRRPALEELSMADPDFGWTIEMQVKAAQRGLRVTEVPVSHRRRRGGRSKVSGTWSGSWRAGKRILGYVCAAKAAELLGRK